MQETNGDRNIFAQALGVAAKAGNLEAVKLMVKFPTRWWNKDMVVNKEGETVLMEAAAHGQHEVMDWLMREGADVRLRSPNGETAEDLARTSEAPGETLAVLQQMETMATKRLLAPLAKGRMVPKTDFERIMAAGALVNTVENSTGLTAVALASKYGMTEMVRMLAPQGADLDWRDPARGHCVLHMACDHGHFNAVITLLEYGADPSAVTDHFEMDCLQLAAMNGRNGIVQAMLDHGRKYPERKADPKRTNYNGETALLMFTRQLYGSVGQQAQILKLLIEGGSDVNVKSADGTKGSPIYYSIDHNQAEAMILLAEAGADTAAVAVDEEDGRQVGAFEQSLRSGCQACAAWLIKSKRREDFQFTKQQGGRKGVTALYSAVMQDWLDVSAALLEDGVDPNVVNMDMATPLFAAALRGNKDMIDLLIRNGANVEARNRGAETALCVAANLGKVDAVRALIAVGANINAQDKSHTTPLFRAAMNGHLECVVVLLKAGADSNQEGFVKPNKGKGGGGRAGMAKLETPASIARRHGHTQVAEVIEKYQHGSNSHDAHEL
eukprot:SAG31_NODE_6697_length_1922_cov_1.157981_1_plen_554_part_10